MPLFHRYRNFLVSVFLVVVLLSVGLFGLQWRSAYRHELSIIQDNFNESAVNLAHIVDSTAHHLHSLKVAVEEDMQLNAQPVRAAALRSKVVMADDQRSYALMEDRETATFALGLLEGAGNLQEKAQVPSFEKELNAVLRLYAGFRATMENLHDVSWAYYTSAQQFMSLYPNNPEFDFDLSMLDMAFFQDGMPENNPARSLFWTEAYADLAGQGLMVTAGVPVYEGDSFRGTVALDFTLKSLTNLVRDFSYGQGALFISGAQQQLLAHPELVTAASNNQVKPLASALPSVLQNQVDTILASPVGQVQSLGSFLVLHEKSENAPWHLIAVVPKRSVYGAIAANSLPSFLIPLLGLVICLLATRQLLDNLFIKPAFDLVEHIKSESQGGANAVPTSLPEAWRLSFDKISYAFAENRRLLKELESQLAATVESTQIQLAQGEKMSALGNLVAGVAHEINNPVGFVRGNVVELKRNLDDLLEHLSLYQEQASAQDIEEHAEEIDLEYLLEDTPKILGSMTTGCDRIRDISTSLRTFSRADTEEKSAFDLQEGLDSTILILKHRLKGNEHRPEIVVKKQYRATAAIQCFPGQLNQVFMNILANAIDMFDEAAEKSSFEALQDQPQKILVSTEITADDTAEIRIKDNGNGMPEEIREQIFDHLYTTKEVGKGTGLGLTISHQIIVEKHSGELSVHSEVGKGTEFVIRIPATGSETVPEATSENISKTISSSTEDASPESCASSPV